MTRPTNAAAPPNIRKHLMTFIRDTPTARRFRRFASALLGSTALIGLAMAGAARADETWTGATSSDWFDASNWSPATVPTAAVNVFVDRGGGVGAGTPSAITGSSASAATVTIGVNSLGLLDVENGGSLTTGTVTLGVNIGAYGALGVSNGGTITSSGSLVIGNLGVGDAQFADTGSQVTFAHDAEIGFGNSGGLTILDGATLVDTNGYVGVGQNIRGDVRVDGSTWTNNASLYVGYAGIGTLTVLDSGKVTNTDAEIGLQPGASGTVIVSGAGSEWNSSGSLLVGAGGTGELDILSGGHATVAGSATVGASTGSTGTVGVGGQNSLLAVSGGLSLGLFSGTGQMKITDKGEVDAASVTLGVSAGSVGNIMVDGATLDASGAVVIGSYGTGTVTLQDAGHMLAGSLDLGANAHSSGTLTIIDPGSEASIDQGVIIGDAGTGTVSAGGFLDAASATIGSQSGSTGTATFAGTGAGLKTHDDLVVGEGGDGTLNIQNGAVVSVGGVTYIGQDQGSTGTLAIDGGGSALNATGYIYVGGDGVDPTGGNGTVTVSHGGALSTLDGFAVAAAPGASGNVTVDGAGSKINAAYVAVGVDGSGTLSVQNGGAVAVTGSNFGIGVGAGSTGTASVTGAGSTIAVTNVLFIGHLGTGALTISNGGLVSAAGTLIADNAGSTGSLNIGGAVGSAAAASGTLATPTVTFGAGSGSINFNHTDPNYTFAAAISGPGTINQIAGTTILTADSSGFTGSTNVTGGRLAVNGSLSGSIVTVSGGGILGGNGTVGGIVAEAGGIVGPGNSIGTLNVAGDVAQASGSTYQVELTSTGQSDLIHATGMATIASGAVLDVIKTDAAPYVIGTQYTVLEADGGVSGIYTVSNVSAFVGLVEQEDQTHVYLDVEKTKSFASAGATPNQIATAGGVESIGGGSVYNAILNIPTDAQAQAAFDQLSSEVHASVKGVTIDDSRFARDAALDRLRDAFDAVGAVGTPVLAYADGETTQAIATTDSFAMWGRGFGAWGSHEGDGNAATIKRDIGGLFMGGDGLVTDTVRLGVLAGYSHSSFSVGARNSSGSSDNYHLGLYGGTQWGNLAFRSGAVYTWQDISTDRSAVFPGFAESLKASYSARTAQVFGEFGYRLDVGQTAAGKLAFEPFANLAYVNLATDGFSETGGAAALTSQADTTGVTFTTLGLRGSTEIATGSGMAITARGMLGWRHAYGDTTPLSTMAFAGGLPFTIAGAPIAKDAAVVEAGLDINLTPAATLGIAYDGQFGSGLTDQSVKGTLGVKF